MTVAPIPAAAVAAILAGCTPALDWREVRPVDSEALALFPCKPERLARRVRLGGAEVEMRLASCRALDTTYAVAYARLADPRHVTPALEQLRLAAAANIGAAVPSPAVWAVAGMTPHPLAGKLDLRGHDAQGTPVQEQAVFFTRGLHVYQVTVVGPAVDPEAAATFFDSVRLLS